MEHSHDQKNKPPKKQQASPSQASSSIGRAISISQALQLRTPADVLTLQRTLGNRVTQGLLAGSRPLATGIIQRLVTIDDLKEHEEFDEVFFKDEKLLKILAIVATHYEEKAKAKRAEIIEIILKNAKVNIQLSFPKLVSAIINMLRRGGYEPPLALAKYVDYIDLEEAQDYQEQLNEERKQPGQSEAAEHLAKIAESMPEVFTNIKWVGSGSDPRLRKFPQVKKDKGKLNNFALWIFALAYFPAQAKLFQPQPSERLHMNCWEGVMFTAYQAGLVDETWLAEAHRKASQAGDYFQALTNILNFNKAVPFSVSAKLVPQKGDIIFFDGAEHVALSLGNDKKGQQVLIHLWHNIDRMGVSGFEITTIEDIRRARPDLPIKFAPCPFKLLSMPTVRLPQEQLSGTQTKLKQPSSKSQMEGLINQLIDNNWKDSLTPEMQQTLLTYLKWAREIFGMGEDHYLVKEARSLLLMQKNPVKTSSSTSSVVVPEVQWQEQVLTILKIYPIAPPAIQNLMCDLLTYGLETFPTSLTVQDFATVVLRDKLLIPLLKFYHAKPIPLLAQKSLYQLIILCIDQFPHEKSLQQLAYQTTITLCRGPLLQFKGELLPPDVQKQLEEVITLGMKTFPEAPELISILRQTWGQIMYSILREYEGGNILEAKSRLEKLIISGVEHFGDEPAVLKLAYVGWEELMKGMLKQIEPDQDQSNLLGLMTFGLEIFADNENVTRLAYKLWTQLVRMILNLYRDIPMPLKAQNQLISLAKYARNNLPDPRIKIIISEIVKIIRQKRRELANQII